MGIVVRQSFFNTIGSYIGVGIGAINTIILLPYAFEDNPAFLGMINLFLAATLIASSVLTLGLPHALITFFPKYDRSQQSQLFSFSLVLVTFMTFVFVVVGIYAKDSLIEILGDDENIYLLEKYYYFLLPLIFIAVYFDIVDSVLQAHRKVIFSQFLRDAFRRIILSIGALLIISQLIYENLFFIVLITGYALQLIIIIMYAKPLLPVLVKGFKQINLWEVCRYGFFVMLTASAGLIMIKLDVTMISSLVGLEEVAYYNIAFFIGSIVGIPSRSLALSVRPLISNAWARGDIEKVEGIYKKSATNQLIINGGLFLFIWANLDWIMLLLPENYRVGYWVIILTGLGLTYTGATGVNGLILVVTDKYRYTFYFNILLIIIGIFFNFILIPVYGIEGAAIATFLAMGINNLLRAWMLKRYFNIAPFTKSSYKTLFIFSILALIFAGIRFAEIPHWIYIITFNISNIIFLYYVIIKMKASEDIHSIYIEAKEAFIRLFTNKS